MNTYNTPILTRILKSARTKDYFNCIHPVPMIDYDHLYEQWNKPAKPQWNKFFLANNIESVTFKEKLELKSLVLMTKVRMGKFVNPDSYYYAFVKNGDVVLNE